MELRGRFLGKCEISFGDAVLGQNLPTRARATLAFFMLRCGEHFPRERLLEPLYEHYGLNNPRKALINDLYIIRSSAERIGLDAREIFTENGSGIGISATV